MSLGYTLEVELLLLPRRTFSVLAFILCKIITKHRMETVENMKVVFSDKHCYYLLELIVGQIRSRNVTVH